jgi:Tol biopolymer transport system component
MSEDGFYPQWSPDGSRVIYGSTRGESFDIYIRDVDLSRPEQILFDVENNLRSADWTRQGVLVIREEIPDKGMDLRSVADVDAPSMAPLMEGQDNELAPVVSSDGKWMAFVSNYSGRDEIYVTTFPDTGARSQISIKGGTSPTWAPDGSAVYYFEGTSLVAVSVETEPRFRVTGRKRLFDGDYVQYRWSRQYDIHPDGTRFILIKRPTRSNVEVVTHWFTELPAAED